MSKTLTLQEVREFVKKELVPVNHEVAACADGRTPKEVSKGGIRMFGGDYGMVLAFAAALRAEGTFLEPDEIVERYYRAVREVRGENTKLFYHSDEHSHKEGKIGCGHAREASDPRNDGLYGVTSLEAKSLYDSFAAHPHSNISILEGHHDEKGVLVVEGNGNGLTHSVNSRNKRGDKFYVVEPSRIDALIDATAPIFSRGLLVSVDPEDVKAKYIMQQGETSRLLGADKLPTFRVGFKPNGDFMMEQISTKRKKLN